MTLKEREKLERRKGRDELGRFVKGQDHPSKTREIRDKISESQKGRIAWNKGLTGLPKQSEDTKKKRSKSIKKHYETHSHTTKGKPNYRLKGIPLSNEHIEKLSKAWNYEKHFTEQTKQNLRLSRKNHILPKKDSKPERMMQLALTLHGIKFEKHKLFETKTLWHRPDIFIQPNIIVEVDGVRFHVNPTQIRRDLYQSQEFNLMGYHVIRIRDIDILKDVNNCALRIINLIKEIQFGVKII